MLHIHNGDSTAGTAKKANIPGEHLAWREAMVCGPAPADLPETEFINLRANHLANAYDLTVEKCTAELRDLHQALEDSLAHDEVVLWFEHDLFCQVHLIYLLHWFAQRELGQTRLSLVSIDQFPGIKVFHGLGQLDEGQLESLWPARQEITPAQLEIGSKAWASYSSSNPKDLTSLLETDISALPFLREALKKHLQRFPSTHNGLGRIENIGVELVSAGYPQFKSLFPAFIRREPRYGFGDSQFYLAMHRLATAPVPVLRQKDEGNSAKDPARMLLSSFEITSGGEAIMTGKEDFVLRNGIDIWLGGVHLQGKESPWRWDEETQELLVSL
jgi:hypothetical protein